MKKTTLFVLGLLAFSASAQKALKNIQTDANPALLSKDNRANKIYDEAKPFNGTLVPASNRTNIDYIIGNTTYDLQTNSSNQRRIVNHGDGTLSATFTFGDNAPAFNDRGAGYNYYNGSNWSTNPTTRIENTRSGWPSITTSNNDEIIISHTGTGGLIMNYRATKGTGAWTQTTIPTNTGDDIVWPRVAIGGSNDSTIHVVAIVGGTDTAFRYKGLQTGALLYYRSKNLGATWDIIDSLLPGFDTSAYIGHSGDSYAIDASKNTVAITYFPTWSDLITLKSLDNGDTWTKLVVNDFPVDKYEADQGFDLDSNNVQDSTQLLTTDGSGTVIIDENDMVHVVFGADLVVDWDLTDGGTSHFPLTDILVYWNENFGTDSLIQIAEYLDYNGDDTVISSDFLNGGSVANLPDYRVSGLSMPSMGISTDGKLFVTYAAFAETFSNGTSSFRHIYALKSIDGGTTWTTPIDLTPDLNYDLYEHVYPSMAKLVDSRAHIVFQRDQIPGVYVIDETSTSYNDIIYLGIDTALQAPAASINEIKNTVEATLFPNPANEELFVKINASKSSNLVISIVDAVGRVVISEKTSLVKNTNLINLNIASLRNGAYTVILNNSESVISKVFIKQ